MIPAWISLVLSGVVAILAAGITVGLIRGTLNEITKGQTRLQESVDELSATTGKLATAAAVNSFQHDEMARRVSFLETKLGECVETIRLLRTRSHVLANKIQEMDPKWHPYADKE